MTIHQREIPQIKPASERHDRSELLLRYLSLSPQERSKEFLTVSEVAKWVGKTPKAILGWITYDKIAGIKVGERTWYVYKRSVIEYLQDIQEHN